VATKKEQEQEPVEQEQWRRHGKRKQAKRNKQKEKGREIQGSEQLLGAGASVPQQNRERATVELFGSGKVASAGEKGRYLHDSNLLEGFIKL
jgi:hypothetical protein